MVETMRNVDLETMRNIFNERFDSIIEGRLFFTMEEPFEDLLRRTGALLEGHFVLTSACTVRTTSNAPARCNIRSMPRRWGAVWRTGSRITRWMRSSHRPWVA